MVEEGRREVRDSPGFYNGAEQEEGELCQRHLFERVQTLLRLHRWTKSSFRDEAKPVLLSALPSPCPTPIWDT